jgi:predicted Rossmann fold flavoprotein
VHLAYRRRVKEVAIRNHEFALQTEEGPIHATRVILATGGLSWPQTGSTGDGYRFAAQLGHTIVPSKPALVPLIARETWPPELAGVSLPDVRIRTAGGGRKLATSGNMLFTQKGIGGPAVLDLSRLLADDLGEEGSSIGIEIDVLPGMDESRLDRQLQQECRASPKKAVANLLSELVPRQFARTVCRLASCEADLPAGQLPTDKRRRLVKLLKTLPLCVTGTESIAKATVTRGGVHRGEIDPRTMASRICPGLFFAGEVIDLDGPCGGYNLQMCWSTGAAAGHSAARSLLGQ